MCLGPLHCSASAAPRYDAQKFQEHQSQRWRVWCIVAIYLQLLLIAGEPEEEVLLLAVDAGLAMYRAVMLFVDLIILLVLFATHTVPACNMTEAYVQFFSILVHVILNMC